MPSWRPLISAGVTRSSAGGDRRRQERLAHMRDIEQPGFLAGVQMFLQDAGGILHRHVIAGERHHLAAQLQMQRMKRRRLQDFACQSVITVPNSMSPASVQRGGTAPLCHGT